MQETLARRLVAEALGTAFLLTTVVGFTALFVLLTVLRKGQLDLATSVAALERKAGIVT